MIQNKMEVKKICVKCGEVGTVDALTMRQLMCRSSSGDNFQLTFCECEKCGEIIPLQFDDERTMQDLRKITTLIGRRVRNRSTGQRNAENDKKTYEKLNKRLEERRAWIWKENEGQTIYLKNSGKILIKSLTSNE